MGYVTKSQNQSLIDDFNIKKKLIYSITTNNGRNNNNNNGHLQLHSIVSTKCAAHTL